MSEPSPYRVILSYDGRSYFGWQRLRDKPTIQGALEAAIATAFGESVAVEGAGRTDRGAHAEGQVATFRLQAGLPAEELRTRLNEALPADIRIVDAAVAEAGFHARTSAISKDYAYRIANREQIRDELAGRVWHLRRGTLDTAAMAAALPSLVGRHDFASFATPSKHARGPTVRHMRACELEVSGDVIVLRFHADSFLTHMVRNIVRAVVKVGEGRYRPERIAEILRAANRAASPGSAPASGLYLMKVHYSEEPERPEGP